MAIGNMQAHEDRRDSGIDWLGEIPGHWRIKPGLVAIAENKRDNKGMKETQVLSLSYGNIVVKPEEKLTGLVPESFETYQVVEPGDIIIRGTDLQNDQTSLRTGLAKDRGIITSAYIGLRVKDGFNSAFVHYYLHALDTCKILYKFGSGLRQNLGFEDFKRIPIVEIPTSEQDAIVRFLDEKTAKIEDAIALEERQIALLKERKQIVTQNAVTKGLNPTAPMKDSGVDWIGEIPAHWTLKKIKHVMKERNERSQSGDEPLLMMSQTHGLVVRSEYHEKAEVAESSVDNKIVKSGDLVFNKLKAHLGVFFKSDIPFDGIVSPDYAVYRPYRHVSDLKFFENLFRHPKYIEQFIARSSGIVEGLIRLYTSELFDIYVPVPPEGEQRGILAAVQEVQEQHERAIGLKIRQIASLKEYKATLINSAVTGKIKVA